MANPRRHTRDTAPSAPLPSELTALSKYASFPANARRRELVKIVEKYSGNGIHLFIHYTSPILEVRRKALHAGGTRTKKYYRTASQLWNTLDDEQKSFWNHQAKIIRLGIANGTLSHEQCILDAGFRSEWEECLRFSETAVAGYLQIALPDHLQETAVVDNIEDNGDGERSLPDRQVPSADDTTFKEESTPCTAEVLHLVRFQEDSQNNTFEPSEDSPSLLDTLRDPFTAEPRMIYGNFAQLYPYHIVREAEGKHQTALLRQLADLLDPTGKKFF